MNKNRHTLRHVLLVSAVAGLTASFSSSGWAASCEELRNLKLPDTEIKSAVLVAPGTFTGPDNVAQPDLPGFCRVVASVKNAHDSDIGVEIWLPSSGWKHVFHGNGNGAYAGTLSAGYPGMAEGIRRGYASAVTDTGTAPAMGPNGDPLIGHPQKWKDWGQLSTHVMTATGKAIAKAFYGEDVQRSYYTGCSTGGQQGLIEAQYYPEDYDGILVGAPVISRTWGHALWVWDFQSANLKPGRKLSDAKLALLNREAVKQCGGKGNGISTDPFISDPMACKFDPARLTCHGADSSSCLAPGEVQTAKDFYSGPLNHAGHATYYGWLPGSEVPGRLDWAFLQAPPNNQPANDGLFKWVFGANWDWLKFDFDRDMPKVDAMLGPSVNGVEVGDVSRFRARGGKLLMYHGWADTVLPPGPTVAFYDGLSKKFGGVSKVQDFARLFMASGMMHCGGGPGANAFNAANGAARKAPVVTPEQDIFTAMTHWVEDGVAPAEIVATKYVQDDPAKGVAFQRPLCPYPQKAWYKGAGDTGNAGNFACAVRKPAAR